MEIELGMDDFKEADKVFHQIGKILNGKRAIIICIAISILFETWEKEKEEKFTAAMDAAIVSTKIFRDAMHETLLHQCENCETKH